MLAQLFKGTELQVSRRQSAGGSQVSSQRSAVDSPAPQIASGTVLVGAWGLDPKVDAID
jgi:hypothetical protein